MANCHIHKYISIQCFDSFNYFFFRHIFRYQAVLLRDRFDKNRNVNDMMQASALVVAGERELFEKQHFQPKKCKIFLRVYFKDKLI